MTYTWKQFDLPRPGIDYEWELWSSENEGTWIALYSPLSRSYFIGTVNDDGVNSADAEKLPKDVRTTEQAKRYVELLTRMES